MMKHFIAKISAWAFLITLLFCVTQLAFSSFGGTFFGVDGRLLAAEVFRLYPVAALTEGLKIHAIMFLFCFFVVGVSLSLSRKWYLRVTCFFIAILSYCSFLGSSILRYPALYQVFLAETLQKRIFNLSRWLSPNVVDLFASLLMIALILLFLWKSIRRRALLIGSLAFGTMAFLLRPYVFENNGRDPSTPDRPNILLIGIDSLRHDHALFQTMPELYALKMDPLTVEAEDHIVGVPRTFPSWVELIQGRYSSKTGVRHMFPDLLAQRRFYPGLVSELSSLGYRSGVISDFAGDIFPRFQAGFTEVDTPNFDLMTLAKMTVDQAFPLFLPFVASRLFSPLFQHFLENPCFSDPELLVDKAIDHLETGRGPFLLSLFFSTAHFPYAAPWPWYSNYSSDDYGGPYFFKKDPDLTTQILSDADIDQVRSLYRGSLSAVDHSLARLFRALKDAGLWEETVVVVTADHGEDLFEFEHIQGHGDHLRGENVLRVPLLMKLTRHRKPVKKNLSFTTRAIDLSPTLIGLLGRTLPQGEGQDLGPWIFGKKVGSPMLSAYSETGIWFTRNGDGFFQKERLDYPDLSGLLSVDPGHSGSIIMSQDYEKFVIAAKHRSLTKGRYKLIYTPTAQGAFFKLYDRELDPQNRRDLSHDLPDVYASMKGELMDLILNLESNVRFIEDFVVPL